MECPNCKHCIITSSAPPPGKNDSAAVREEVVEEDRVKLAVVEEVGVKGKVLEAPCVVCFAPVVGVADRSKIFEPLTPEEIEEDKIFQWFLLNFRNEVASGKKKKIKGQHKDRMERFDELAQYRAEGGWDGEGGRSWPLPICGGCRNEVIGLMEWKNRIKGMGKGKKAEEERLRKGIWVVRRKMANCEPEYLSSGIYEKDKRYRRVRRTIISVLKGHKRRLEIEGFFLEGRVKEEVGVLEVPPHQRETRRTVVREVEVPCVICCEALKIFPDEKKTLKEMDEDKRVFRWFLRNFENPKGQLSFSGGKGKRLRGVELTKKVVWDGMEGKSEPLQFCWGCREGIKEWFDLKLSSPQTKVELGKEVKRIRKRMRECEDKFLASGIYKRDHRYFNVRRNVVNVLETEVVSRIPPPPQLQKQQRKKGWKMGETIGKGQKVLKNEMDKILGDGFGKIGGEQERTEVFMEGEGDEEECDDEWAWEDEEEPATIGHGEEGEGGMGMDPLGLDTEVEAGAMEFETGDNENERFEVKQEEDLEDDKYDLEMDLLGPGLDAAGGIEDENQEDPYRNCLLCYEAISKRESALAPVLTNDLNEQNLNVMFILRKMLNVPEERLVGYLENYGCPGKWVEFCKNCLGMVDAALRIQKEINKLEEKLRSYQDKMVQKIMATSEENGNISKEKCEKLPDEIIRITEETRYFVSFHERKKLKTNVTRQQPRPVFVLPAPPPLEPEVASCVFNENDNESLEPSPSSSPSPPSSPPDDSDIDPSYVEDADWSPPEQVDLDLEGSSGKRIKLSANVKVKQHRAANNSKKDAGQSLGNLVDIDKAGNEVVLKLNTTEQSSDNFLKCLKEKIYNCPLCPHIQKHMSLFKFYRHLIFHSQRPFKCTICNLYWSGPGPSELEKNPFVKKPEHPSNEHVCSEATLVKLSENYPGSGLWKCKWCPDKKFEKEAMRDLHEEKRHPSLQFQFEEMEHKCLSCSKVYPSYRDWLLHRVLEHPQIAATSCLFCDFSAVIQTKEGIDVLDWLEMKKHTGLEHPKCRNIYLTLYTCEFCGIPVGEDADLKARHIKNHHGLTRVLCTYTCPCCHHRTDKLTSLRNHLRRHSPSLDPAPPSINNGTGEEDILRDCEICGKEGLSLVQLCDHKLVRHGVEPEEGMEGYNGQQILSCGRADECGGFRTLIKRNLAVHQRVKHGEKNWECEKCGKGFLSRCNLRRHLKTHQEENTDEEDEEEEEVTSSAQAAARKKQRQRLDFNQEEDDMMSGTLNEEVFKCSLCPNLEIEPMSLEKFCRHVIFHFKRPLKCIVCNVYWSSEKELEKNPFFKENPSREHVCSEATLVKCSPPNGGKIWRCKWCPVDKIFEMEIERDSHEHEEHLSLLGELEMKWKCLSCSKKYRSYREWLLHRVLEHPGIAAISCLFCDLTSVSETKEGIEIFNIIEMRAHVNWDHSPACQNLCVGHDTCDFCGISFEYSKKWDKLARHIKEDHKLGSGLYTCRCPCCYFRTSSFPNLRKHMRLHHLLSFQSSEPKKRNAQQQLNREDVQKICDICGIIALSWLELCDHKMGRHGLKPEEIEEYRKKYKVLECERGTECGGYRTLLSRKMREHMMKKHGAERKWKCEQCGKGFTTGRHLRIHQEIHENKGLRPYQCEICGNSFAVKNYLYIHMRLSHQNRPFASTNRKRTTKRGPSKMAKISEVESEGVRAMAVPSIPIDLPTTQLGANVDSIV